MRISADAGMPPAVAAEAFRVLIAYTVGFVAFEIGRATSANGDRPLPSGTNLEGLDRSAGDSDFNRGLEWLMNGLASTIEEGH